MRVPSEAELKQFIDKTKDNIILVWQPCSTTLFDSGCNLLELLSPVMSDVMFDLSSFGLDNQKLAQKRKDSQ
jgi:hypothetical protein